MFRGWTFALALALVAVSAPELGSLVKPSATDTVAPVGARSTSKPSPPAERPPSQLTGRVTVTMPVVPPPAVTSIAPRANRTALLIGIDRAPGTRTLEGSITDVNNMRDILLRRGYRRENIVKLTNADASRDRILASLDDLSARTSGNGLAVFLLATHTRASGGDVTFATGGGGRVSRHELASRLVRVPGKLWSMLPTCYAAAYARRGIVGHDRIAVFASRADEVSYQIGDAGSWLVLYMVKYAMLERRSADRTIEGAFRWAKETLEREHPDRVPIMRDGIAGDRRL